MTETPIGGPINPTPDPKQNIVYDPNKDPSIAHIKPQAPKEPERNLYLGEDAIEKMEKDSKEKKEGKYDFGFNPHENPEGLEPNTIINRSSEEKAEKNKD